MTITAKEAFFASLENLKSVGVLDVSQMDQNTKPQFIKNLDGQLAKFDSSIQQRVRNEFLQHGAIDSLINDTEVTEIIINGHQNIWYEQNARLHAHHDCFFSQQTYLSFVQRLCHEAQLSLNLQYPFASGVWKNFRAQIIIPPLSVKGTAVSLRRISQVAWNLDSLKEKQWATEQELNILKNVITNKNSVLVIGPTGCGKTTVLNACLQQVSQNERCIIIEDTDEIKIPNECSLKLLTRFDQTGQLNDVDQSVLIKKSLRLRPDRIIVGEVRGGEAKDLLMALATGHQGGMGSLHAESAFQALARLEMLVQLGAPQWSTSTVRNLILHSLNYILELGFKENKRVLCGLQKITSLEKSGFLLERVI